MAITDRRQMGPDPLSCAKNLAHTLGPRLILQIREPDLSSQALFRWAQTLCGVCEKTQSTLLINGRADIACAFPEHVGVHLKEHGLPVDDVRRLLGPNRPLSAATHTPEAALRAASRGANLVVLSPIFRTPSKPHAEPLGTGPLSETVRRMGSRALVFALGGVDQGQLQALFNSGAHGVAAIRSIWQKNLLPELRQGPM